MNSRKNDFVPLNTRLNDILKEASLEEPLVERVAGTVTKVVSADRSIPEDCIKYDVGCGSWHQVGLDA